MANQCLILGVGGHGWESLSEFIINFSGQVYGYGTTVDWGGSTGYWGRLLELNQEELNLKLHQKKMPVLPWGDFNKMVTGLGVQNHSAEIVNLLELRSLDFDELWQAYSTLAEVLHFDLDFSLEFKTYLQTVFEFHKDNHDKISNVKPICLAYPLNQFVFFKTGTILGLNLFYQKYNLLPKHVIRSFVSTNRHILVGKNSLGVRIVGEDPIDVHEYPVSPASLKHITRSQKPASVSKEFLTNLKSADAIIIPNGSIANWLPLINLEVVKQILLEKSEQGKIFWLLNLFRTQNEHPIGDYINYLYDQSIQPKLLGPKNIPINLPKSTIETYLAENKIPNLYNESEIECLKKFNKNLYLDLECHLEHSYKYEPNFVQSSLNKMLI